MSNNRWRFRFFLNEENMLKAVKLLLSEKNTLFDDVIKMCLIIKIYMNIFWYCI